MVTSKNIENSSTLIQVNDSLTSVMADEDLDTDTYEDDAKWYSIAILVLALVGVAVNLTAVILLRKKKGIFHKMLKVRNTKNILKYLDMNNY